MLAELSYLLGKPAVTGQYKQQFADFIVQEDLGFELDNEGEHVLVYLRKQDCNTQFVAEQLAQFVGIPAKLVSYAGLKDRHAVTEQWFSLHMPGQATPDFSEFSLAGCQILNIQRHSKKLKIGALKGNHFTLLLKEISNKSELEQRLNQIKQQGVPNYFGEQRFGRDNNNISQAISWAKGEIKVKDRKKRSFYLSAARSAIFNAMVSTRIQLGTDKTALDGDILQLSDRGSWFIAQSDELADLQLRLNNGEINVTAPLVGDDKLGTANQALIFEEQCLSEWSDFLNLFKQERMQTARRSILLRPKELSWQWIDDATIELNFYLLAGSYATSVLRELII